MANLRVLSDTSASRWTTRWRSRSKLRCNLAVPVATAGNDGRCPANSCRLRLQGKYPVSSRSRRRAEVAVAVNARRRHQNGDAVERRARSANRCVPRAGFASTCNRREIPTSPYGWAKWKPLSLARSPWRDARSLARAFDAVYRAESAWRAAAPMCAAHWNRAPARSPRAELADVTAPARAAILRCPSDHSTRWDVHEQVL